jgi:hypothetical protein
VRSPSSILFLLILVLSVALVTWWTVFQVTASAELEAAGRHLIAGAKPKFGRLLPSITSSRTSQPSVGITTVIGKSNVNCSEPAGSPQPCGDPVPWSGRNVHG